MTSPRATNVWLKKMIDDAGPPTDRDFFNQWVAHHSAVKDLLFYKQDHGWLCRQYASNTTTFLSVEDFLGIIRANSEFHCYHNGNEVRKARVNIHTVGFDQISAILDFRIADETHVELLSKEPISISLHSANGCYASIKDNVTMFTLPVKE